MVRAFSLSGFDGLERADDMAFGLEAREENQGRGQDFSRWPTNDEEPRLDFADFCLFGSVICIFCLCDRPNQ